MFAFATRSRARIQNHSRLMPRPCPPRGRPPRNRRSQATRKQSSTKMTRASGTRKPPVAETGHTPPSRTLTEERERLEQEEALDEALKNTFPASDPVSDEQPVNRRRPVHPD